MQHLLKINVDHSRPLVDKNGFAPRVGCTTLILIPKYIWQMKEAFGEAKLTYKQQQTYKSTYSHSQVGYIVHKLDHVTTKLAAKQF